MTRLDGIDTSHYQGVVNWPAVKAAGCWWAATKATQGVAYIDPTMAVNRSGMAQTMRVRGLYHWLTPATDAVAQARWFLHAIGSLAVGEFAMLDAEQAGITIAQVVAWCETVEAVTHRPCAVYTGAYVAGIWTSLAVRASRYGQRPMILAAYTTEDKAKTLPGVAAHPWDGWQYSSDGPVPGVVGRCDMDRIDNPAAFDVACGIATPVVTAPPTPIPTPILEDDMSQSDTIITNAQQFFASPPLEAKFLLLANGKLRHLELLEWQTRGSDPGTPWTNDAIGKAGVVPAA